MLALVEPVRITLSPKEIMQEINPTKHTHEPVKPLEMVLVQIPPQKPRLVLVQTRDEINSRDKNRAQVISHGKRRPRERGRKGTHR